MKKELMLELLNTKQYKQLHTLLMENNTVDIAYLLQQIEIDDCAIAFRLLSKKKAAQVFSNMDIKTQSQLVELFSEKELESLIENQYMDDLVDLIEELPANLVTRLLKHVDENQRQVINQLLSYPKDSAGTIMTTEFLSLKKETQLEDALNYIKQNGNHCKSIYTSYVCQDKKLIGIVSTKDILLNDENKSIEEIMKEDFQYVYTHTDQEEVVNIFRKYDLVVLPVLDDEKMLVGIEDPHTKSGQPHEQSLGKHDPGQLDCEGGNLWGISGSQPMDQLGSPYHTNQYSQQHKRHGQVENNAGRLPGLLFLVGADIAGKYGDKCRT